MAKRLQLRGGTTTEHSTFTGALREVTVDTTKDTLVVHDGATTGGIPLATATNLTALSATNLTSGTVPDARLSSSVTQNLSTQTLTNKTLTSPKINEDVAVTSTATELNILDGVTSTATELNYSDLATLGTTAASKILTADANNLTTVSGAVANVEDTLTDEATITWNVIDSPVAKVTLAGNRTLSAPSGTTPISGQFVSLLAIQDGTGGRTITWNAAYEFAVDTAPTLTATANLGDLFTFRYNGSKWLEVGRNLALTLS